VGLFQEFCEILKNPQVQGSAIADQGLTANHSLGGGENCAVYSLLCVFIIIIIINIFSSSIISTSFVVLLNCLYLSL